jgi:outer membrane protein assembly factor BamB
LLLVGIAALLVSAGCGRRPGGGPVSPATEISASASSAPVDADSPETSPEDWPGWRGPNTDGVAVGPAPPTTWSETENIVWKIDIPGRGHSSPIVVGDRIYLETADDGRQIQSVLCFNIADGAKVWEKEIHRGNFEQAMHSENTQASSTLASDGKRLYALFLNDRKIWATALDLNGEQLWQTEVGGFASRFGYSASPVLFQNRCIVAADHSSGGFVAALHCDNGEILWRKPRPPFDSYATPRVVTLGGKPQIILGGNQQIVSYDPESGNENWKTNGTAVAVVGSAVTANDLVLASGGYPQAETLALRPDGTVAWRKNVKSYVPSLLAYESHIYLSNDDGVAVCWDAATGDEKWKQRIGGNFRVSPLLAGGHIYVTDMSAKTTVYNASPEKYEAVAENQLGSEAFASPAVSGGRLFLRVADRSGGGRQERLYCIGDASSAKVSQHD